MDRETYLVLRVTSVDAGFDSLSPSVRSGRDSSLASTEFEYRVESPLLDDQDIRELRRDRGVAAIAKPIPLQRIRTIPSATAAHAPAPIDDSTWGVHVTGASQSPYVGYGAIVAVLDTGIDADHEAFRGVELVQRDFTGEGNGDTDGHGTHVAGTIFGRAVGGPRYAVAPGVSRALIGKVIGERQSATTKEIIDAIQWAVDEGAHIINMSLGFDFPGLVQHWVERGLPVDLATSRALAQYRDNIRFFDATMNLLRARAAEFGSALLVAAAGNESQRDVRPDYAIEVSPPAAADGIVSVAALQSLSSSHDVLGVASFSNIRVALAAPGVGIYSAKAGGGFAIMNGTSMASPHVVGVAALWVERQLKRTGHVNVTALDAQLRGNARRDGLRDVGYLDVGEGLVAAPRD